LHEQIATQFDRLILQTQLLKQSLGLLILLMQLIVGKVLLYLVDLFGWRLSGYLWDALSLLSGRNFQLVLLQ